MNWRHDCSHLSLDHWCSPLSPWYRCTGPSFKNRWRHCGNAFVSTVYHRMFDVSILFKPTDPSVFRRAWVYLFSSLASFHSGKIVMISCIRRRSYSSRCALSGHIALLYTVTISSINVLSFHRPIRSVLVLVCRLADISLGNPLGCHCLDEETHGPLTRKETELLSYPCSSLNKLSKQLFVASWSSIRENQWMSTLISYKRR